MKKTLTLVGLALVLITLVGCAKEPTVEMDAAKQALEAAKQAEAAQYASESLSAAQDQLAQLETEVAAQKERFALMRSYDKAKEIAASAKAAAEKAQADAVEGKNRARDEASQLISDVRTALEEVKALIAQAPRGKNEALAIQEMQGDLAGVESSLPEIESAFSSERYLDAIAKAEAAKQTVEGVRTEITTAIEASKAGRRR